MRILSLKHFWRKNMLEPKGIESQSQIQMFLFLNLYCFHTAGVLHIFMHVTFRALEYHFRENLKLILKENQIMKQAGFIIDK